MIALSKMAGIIVLFSSLALCGSVFAGPTWTCSVTSAVAVDEDGTIGQPDLGGLERPTFFKVDADKKELTLLAPESRRGEVTKIDSIREGEGLWVFSGVENARAWSMIITEKGHVTLSVVSDGVVWSVFGNAMLDGKDSAKDSKQKK